MQRFHIGDIIEVHTSTRAIGIPAFQLPSHVGGGHASAQTLTGLCIDYVYRVSTGYRGVARIVIKGGGGATTFPT